MISSFDKIHDCFRLNDKHFSKNELLTLAQSYIYKSNSHQRQLGNFLIDWFDSKDFILSKTSGSTGSPKTIKIKKQAMVNSAIATGEYFKLKPRNKAILCLPTQAISGKMMFVRALVIGLELDIIKPSKSINISMSKQYDFCALTPMQLKASLMKVNNIKTIIVGGAAVNSVLHQEILKLQSDIYETYGMTETVSHIAVKKLNNLNKNESSSFFKVFPDISISTDKRGCLIINAPKLSSNRIVSNDIVNINKNNQFEWLGRIDNVINSGGIKLNPEMIELKIQNKTSRRFFVSGIPDDLLGEKLVVIFEGKEIELNANIFDSLSKYEMPKDVIFIDKFIETTSGKIQRSKTLDLIN